jgi:hypothetical protein
MKTKIPLSVALTCWETKFVSVQNILKQSQCASDWRQVCSKASEWKCHTRMVSKRVQDYACRTIQSLLTRFSTVITSLSIPQDGVTAKISRPPQIKKRHTQLWSCTKCISRNAPSSSAIATLSLQCPKGTTLIRRYVLLWILKFSAEPIRSQHV